LSMAATNRPWCISSAWSTKPWDRSQQKFELFAPPPGRPAFATPRGFPAIVQFTQNFQSQTIRCGSPDPDFIPGPPAARAKIIIGVHLTDGYAGGLYRIQETLRETGSISMTRDGALVGKIKETAIRF